MIIMKPKCNKCNKKVGRKFFIQHTGEVYCSVCMKRFTKEQQLTYFKGRWNTDANGT